jgi:hypothetical protein
MNGASTEDIPNYLVARNARALRVAMLRNNARHGTMFKYFDIQFADGKWYAWFFFRIDVRTDPLLNPHLPQDGEE